MRDVGGCCAVIEPGLSGALDRWHLAMPRRSYVAFATTPKRGSADQVRNGSDSSSSISGADSVPAKRITMLSPGLRADGTIIPSSRKKTAAAPTAWHARRSSDESSASSTPSDRRTSRFVRSTTAASETWRRCRVRFAVGRIGCASMRYSASARAVSRARLTYRASTPDGFQRAPRTFRLSGGLSANVCRQTSPDHGSGSRPASFSAMIRSGSARSTR